MNVLVLTPDAVGSTLLQRLITVYMQLNDFDRPVINLHELTNGIEKYFSPDFNQEIVSKKHSKWSYYQSLTDVIKLLDSVDHYKVSRLAHYHLKRRNDQNSELIPFYNYLNENFFIISTRRRNLFEHALSWSINKITKKLNVYSAKEKIDAFVDIYNKKIQIDQTDLVTNLNAYQEYINWSEQYFQISSYFYYEDHVSNLEQYILNLPIFKSCSNRSDFKSKFGIEFNDWNKCHYLISSIGSAMLFNEQKLLKNSFSDNLPMIGNNIISHLPVAHRNFIKSHVRSYVTVSNQINLMTKLDIIPTPIPIKKQTFLEKQMIVKNFNECAETFNAWLSKHPAAGTQITTDTIQSQHYTENKFWNLTDMLPATTSILGLSNQPQIS